MTRQRGKPCKVERKIVINAIIKRSSDIIRPNNKIVSKLDPIWRSIAADLNDKLSARTLYSMVCQTDIRRQVLSSTNDADINCDSVNDSSANCSAVSTNTVENDSSEESGSKNFTIWANKEDFEKLFEEKVYKRRDLTRRKQYERQCTVLKPGLWQEWVTNEIWNLTKIQCAFNFHNSKFTRDGKSGTIHGTCNCGGRIFCSIDNCIDSVDDKSTRIDCVTKEGHGQCGKRYLRAPSRKLVGQELLTKSAAVYRTEKADAMMLPGDSEPPHLYKKSALNNAKSEYISSQYLDRDPIRALQIMKREVMQNSIHGIGFDPFYVHYWTNHQLHVYKTYAKQKPACIAIDATGSIVKPLDRCDGTKTSPIYLYHCVALNDKEQYSVCQMLSEKHTTVAISFWLAEWVSNAGLYPKEVVCDSAKALLGAAVKIFTGHATIEEYADACYNSTLPPCYIRIDVAHFIKKYANLLKDSRPRHRILYLAALGQVILSCDKKSAGDILKSILIVARCETDGNLPNGEPTQCEQHRQVLKNLINPCPEVIDNEGNILSDSASCPEDESIFSSTSINNRWSSWGCSIDSEAKNISRTEEGDRDNANYSPKLADRLLSDISWLPLWSCVCRNQFGYGRVPATSASVESEFNIIKTHLLRNETRPMRADVFLQKHLNHINGHMKVVGAPVALSTNKPSNIAESDISTSNSDDLDIRHEDNTPLRNNIIEDPMEDPIYNSSGHVSVADVTPVDSHELLRAETETVSLAKRPGKQNVQSCILCAVPIHDLTNSVSVESENGPTVCLQCSDLESAPKILAAREIEDWRGLNSANPRKKSRYLDKNHATFDTVSIDKLSKIPIMKNGNSLQLQVSKTRQKQYSFAKTCAFDSVLHSLLVTACDTPRAKEDINRLKGENRLMNLVVDIMSKGLRAHSYRLRAEMLIDIHPIAKTTESCNLVDCETNVCYLVGQLFGNTPSIREVTLCSNKCEPRERQLRTVSVTSAILSDPIKFDDVLMEHVALKGTRPCPNKGCTGVAGTEFSETGPFIMMEVNDHQLPLGDIPKSFRDPLSEGRRFTLVGVIHFKPPWNHTRSSGDLVPGIGHYTACVLRPSGVWFEIDDTHRKPSKIASKFIARPHLLIYYR